MPGGADLPYGKVLNGRGNHCIKKFLSQGGNFLGICAGSYYSGRYIEFAKSSPIEVVGSRELGLYNGIVKGPVLCAYHYHSNKGVRAAKLTIPGRYQNLDKDSLCYFLLNQKVTKKSSAREKIAKNGCLKLKSRTRPYGLKHAAFLLVLSAHFLISIFSRRVLYAST